MEKLAKGIKYSCDSVASFLHHCINVHPEKAGIKWIGTISQKMLTVTLRTLKADGYVFRTVNPQIPPRVDYRLTNMGINLIPHLYGLVSWAAENLPDIRESRRSFAEEPILQDSRWRRG